MEVNRKTRSNKAFKILGRWVFINDLNYYINGYEVFVSIETKHEHPTGKGRPTDVGLAKFLDAEDSPSELDEEVEE